MLALVQMIMARGRMALVHMILIMIIVRVRLQRMRLIRALRAAAAARARVLAKFLCVARSVSWAFHQIIAKYSCLREKTAQKIKICDVAFTF